MAILYSSPVMVNGVVFLSGEVDDMGSETAGKKRKITVIDDEKEIVDSIKGFLEPRGYDVSCAFDGKRGMDVIVANMPDIVILDIMMPGMDGRDLICKLKTDEKLKDIPVIFLSAKDEPFEVEYGKELGAAGYLVKPYQARHLMAQINAVLDR